MSSPDFSEISNAISEASREGSRIFASALVDLTQKTSDEIGHQFTIGTRKVFESTREAWNEGGERFSACLKPEMNKLIAGYFALQKSTLEDRWKVTQSGFRGALESCMKKLGEFSIVLLILPSFSKICRWVPCTFTNMSGSLFLNFFLNKEDE